MIWIYDLVGTHYDSLTQDINYKLWAKYINTLIKGYGLKPKTIVDICCGTGSILIQLAKMGYTVSGIDNSAEMLAAASNKAYREGIKINFKMQNAVDFTLLKQVDVFLCLLDSINHFTRLTDIKKLFNNVYKNLNRDGIFIFDINTQYKFENILNKEVFYHIDEEISYIWKNKYSKKTRICDFDLTFFIKQESLYKRIDAKVKERCYMQDELLDILIETGYKNIKIFDGLSQKKPTEISERIFYIAQR